MKLVNIQVFFNVRKFFKEKNLEEICKMSLDEEKGDFYGFVFM